MELPRGIRWSCLECGRSCEDWGEVEVDAATAGRLARLPLFDAGLEPLEDGDLPCGPGREPGSLVLRVREDGLGGTRCVFLDSARRCAVHVAHGPSEKPASCRAFPFHFVDSPDGVRAALSFACTAVLHEHGEDVAAQGALVALVHGHATHRERRGRGIFLAPGDPIGFAGYAALEQRCLELLERLPLALALAAQGRLLREQARLPPADPRPAARLRRFVLAALSGLAGAAPRFRPPLPGLVAPDPERLLRRWIEHRLWRRDLLRGGELLFGHGLLLAETALALEWADRAGLAEAIAQVERGFALHSDLLERLERNEHLRAALGRAFLAPRCAASLGFREGPGP